MNASSSLWLAFVLAVRCAFDGCFVSSACNNAISMPIVSDVMENRMDAHKWECRMVARNGNCYRMHTFFFFVFLFAFYSVRGAFSRRLSHANIHTHTIFTRSATTAWVCRRMQINIRAQILNKAVWRTSNSIMQPIFNSFVTQFIAKCAHSFVQFLFENFAVVFCRFVVFISNSLLEYAKMKK